MRRHGLLFRIYRVIVYLFIDFFFEPPYWVLRKRKPKKIWQFISSGIVWDFTGDRFSSSDRKQSNHFLPAHDILFSYKALFRFVSELCSTSKVQCCVHPLIKRPMPLNHATQPHLFRPVHVRIQSFVSCPQCVSRMTVCPFARLPVAR